MSLFVTTYYLDLFIIDAFFKYIFGVVLDLM